MNEPENHSLFIRARACLDCEDPERKVFMTQLLAREWNHDLLGRHGDGIVESIPVPGRPVKPELVSPAKLANRSVNTEEGRRALVHAICHIEFNAINLALDAVYRFRDMPDAYYTDWLRVADEEAYHFSLLRERLQEMGSDYGEYAAHNGLWEMACKTDHDVMIRMALVPRVLEARGLDVTPDMMERLRTVGDTRTENLLSIILHDEIGHVAIGTRWFRYCCEQRELNADATFESLLQEYMRGSVKGPFYEEARIEAGFSEQEMSMLKQSGGNS